MEIEDSVLFSRPPYNKSKTAEEIHEAFCVYETEQGNLCLCICDQCIRTNKARTECICSRCKCPGI